MTYSPFFRENKVKKNVNFSNFGRFITISLILYLKMHSKLSVPYNGKKTEGIILWDIRVSLYVTPTIYSPLTMFEQYIGIRP